jgi:hypothetical protein|tara:strand:- start:54 stop:587 length:534 start_codon:yes stop_codon:yes gene_type:complete
MGNANWWADKTSLPKRGFRFMVQITIDGQNLSYMAKSIDKPSYTITSTPHKFFNHTFHYPGRVEWNSITLTLVDAMDPNGSRVLYNYLTQIGYIVPLSNGAELTQKSITKNSATTATGIITIQEIDGNGNSAGAWTLNNPFITEANFGQQSYDSEDLMEISVTLQYDWADYSPNVRG